jgi:hypothetical protein
VHELATFASTLFRRITHWLVIRNGARYVLAGTIALAALGALATSGAVPKPPSIPSLLQVGDNDSGYYGWHRWHGYRYFRWHDFGQGQNFGRYQPYVGNWPNISGSGGNAYVGQDGGSATGQAGSGY